MADYIKFCLVSYMSGLPNRESEELAEVEAKLVWFFFPSIIIIISIVITTNL